MEQERIIERIDVQVELLRNEMTLSMFHFSLIHTRFEFYCCAFRFFPSPMWASILDSFTVHNACLSDYIDKFIQMFR